MFKKQVDPVFLLRNSLKTIILVKKNHKKKLKFQRPIMNPIMYSNEQILFKVIMRNCWREERILYFGSFYFYFTRLFRQIK